MELAKTAVMVLAAEHAKPSTIPARATSLSTDTGSYRISQADATCKTGTPDVDAIIGLLGADKGSQRRRSSPSRADSAPANTPRMAHAARTD